MKLYIMFVIIELMLGFTFASGTTYLLTNIYNDLFYSILFSLIFGSLSMLIGIGLSGYFYLRLKRKSDRFLKALSFSFVGFLLFTIVAIIISIFVPREVRVIPVLMPLAGAVIGFNYKLSNSSMHAKE